MKIRLTEINVDGSQTSRDELEVPSAMDLVDGSTVRLTAWDIDITFTARHGKWVQESLDTAVSLQALLAAGIVEARRMRDHPHARDSVRQLSLIVTKLEEAALWYCEQRARDHVGSDALVDWLTEVI